MAARKWSFHCYRDVLSLLPPLLPTLLLSSTAVWGYDKEQTDEAASTQCGSGESGVPWY